MSAPDSAAPVGGAPDVTDLVHDWAGVATGALLGLVDETIRDGLQSPDAPNLSLEQRARLLDHADAVGVSDVIIGMISEFTEEMLAGLLRHRGEQGHGYLPWILARASITDFERLQRLRDTATASFGLNVFMGVSRLRRHVEGWSLDRVTDDLCDIVRRGRAGGFVEARVALEDATRAFPEDLHHVIAALKDAGVTRICLADTCGGSDPFGVAALVSSVTRQAGGIAVEWHGHQDQGMAIANSIAAIDAGAGYVHGTICGVGERNGNAALDTLAVLAGQRYGHAYDWQRLADYVAEGERLFERALAKGRPFFGESSFASATGTHVAAITKAIDLGRPDLARILFSPDSPISRRVAPIARIGFNSGRRTIDHALRRLAMNPGPDLHRRLLSEAMASPEILSDARIIQICSEQSA